MPASGRRRGGPGADLRRSELLDAADRVVQRDGPAASMSVIAAEAGITKPILYRWFGDKGGLFRALAARHTDGLLDQLRLAMAQAPDPRQRVRAGIDAYLRAIEAEPQVYRLLVHGSAATDVDVSGHVTMFVRRLGDEIASGILDELGLPAEDRPMADAWGHGIVGLVRGAGDWWLEQPTITREELVEHLVDLVAGRFAVATDTAPAGSTA